MDRIALAQALLRASSRQNETLCSRVDGIGLRSVGIHGVVDWVVDWVAFLGHRVPWVSTLRDGVQRQAPGSRADHYHWRFRASPNPNRHQNPPTRRLSRTSARPDVLAGICFKPGICFQPRTGVLISGDLANAGAARHVSWPSARARRRRPQAGERCRLGVVGQRVGGPWADGRPRATASMGTTHNAADDRATSGRHRPILAVSGSISKPAEFGRSRATDAV